MTAPRDDSAVREHLAEVLAGVNPGEADYLDAEAILNEFVVIPRAHLPEVVEDGEWFHVDGAKYAVNYVTAAQRRQHALRYLAVAEYLDARAAREAKAAKEAELAARRDALANELTGYPYLVASLVLRVAIDRVIDDEDKLAEYEAQENAGAGGAPSDPSPSRLSRGRPPAAAGVTGLGRS